MRKDKIYMRTTTDELELPIAVAESPGELARMFHTTSASILSLISHKKPGWYRIIIDEEEDADGEDDSD